MKAHDLPTILTSLTLLFATACDSDAKASGDQASADQPSTDQPSTNKASAGKAGSAAEAEPKAPAGEPHHCDFIEATGQCHQWELAADAVKPKEEFCTGSRGKFAQGPCPSEGDLGVCTLKGDKDIHYYDTHKHYQASPAKTECTALKKGTWTAS